MRGLLFLFVGLFLVGCKDKTKRGLTAQEIVDNAILASGGPLYKTTDVSFEFRDLLYKSEWQKGKRILKRIRKQDSDTIIDIRDPKGFRRFIQGRKVPLTDSLATLYSNSVNSVHYFAFLPYGLNDNAVNKELLGEVTIGDQEYYKIKVTFDQEGGGDDFDDVYLYWFNKQSFKPDYLAYKFHVNGGGIRFRVAYNERYVNGIRFVDYKNLKTEGQEVSFYEVDRLYQDSKLQLLSTIELENISVNTSL
ncbi:deoxyribose-phosphate aldolase [Arenibacter sp. 6A1]|uniref:DUF6503 family protein n=1 Tax=Arenibacter sp. 6A1 TaxID=2720391 RepID=UPI001445F90E|nr:DUF6503 family protein [Arenibacter sp. 6A1]NKI25928.1 deoxyribose-phosphate aldolase [Arenibacter sp. 6A1]